MTTVNEYLDRLYQELERIIDDPAVGPEHKQYLLSVFHTISEQVASNLFLNKKPMEIKKTLQFVINKSRQYINTHPPE